MRQAPAPSRAAWANDLALALFGAGSAIVYLMALLRFPLRAFYNLPIINLDKLLGMQPLAGVFLGGCVATLMAAYICGVLALRGAGQLSAATRALILAFPLLFVLLLLFVYPITSIDLYDYAFRGRMLAHYGANTFVAVPQDYRGDPLFWYTAWRRAVTAYGPVWEGMSWVTARLAGQAPGMDSGTTELALFRMLIGYKLLAALGFLLCGAVIWGALGRVAPKQRWTGLFLWLWNPLALWETAGAGHNDAWMALMIVLAVWAYARAAEPQRRIGWSLASFVALTVGGLIKYLALFFGPVLLAGSLRRLPGARERARLVALGALVCGGLVVISYAPFWAGMDTLRNFGARRELYTASWLALFHTLLALVLAKQTAYAVASSLGLALLVPGVAWSAWMAWQEPERAERHMLWLLLWFLFICNPWFQPWYLLWALALVAVQPWRGRVVWSVVLFCGTSLFSYLINVFVFPRFPWNKTPGVWDAVLVLAIYTLPLAALLWPRRSGGRTTRISRAGPPRLRGGALSPRRSR